MGRAGWKLPEKERERLLQAVPPRYATVVADHVTAGKDRAPEAREGRVVGVADDGSGVQALVVEIGGSADRPDGSTYHITWSLEPGRKPVESNDVIRDHGWQPLEATEIRLEPAADT